MITVSTRTDQLSRTIEYPTATKWHTDEHGALHVIESGNGNVGAHAPGTWAYVLDERPKTDAELITIPPSGDVLINGMRFTILEHSAPGWEYTVRLGIANSQ